MRKALDALLASVKPYSPDAEWSSETTESGLPYVMITMPCPADPFSPPGYVIVTPRSCGTCFDLGDHNVPITPPIATLLALSGLAPLFVPSSPPQATGASPHGATEAREGLAR